MLDDDDDFEDSIWNGYKSRGELKRHRGANTYRRFVAVDQHYSMRMHTNVKKHRNYKCFDVYTSCKDTDALVVDELLDRVNLFEAKEAGSLNSSVNIRNTYGSADYYIFSEYSLNKKKRWLLPELLASISDERVTVNGVKTIEDIHENRRVLGIRLAENGVDENNADKQDCDCQFEIRCKRGNRFVVKKCKNKKCQKLSSVVRKNDMKPNLLFDFNFGFHKRFYRHQDCRYEKPCRSWIEYKNYKVRNRTRVAEHLRSEVNDVVFSVKESKEAKNGEYKHSFGFYFMRKRIVTSLTADGNYNISFIHGQRSFSNRKAVRRQVIAELESCKSLAKQVRGKSITCDICCSDVSCLLSIEPCQHVACYTCWISYVKAMIGSFKATTASAIVPISCLQHNCETQLSLDFLSTILKDDQINEYKDVFFEAQLSRSDKYTVCRKTDCDKILVRSSENENAIVCACNEMICGLCKIESHFPLPCKYYSLLQAQLLNKRIVTEGKCCPKCSRYIEKNGGCSHMRCLCGHSFCWLCMCSMTDHFKCIPVETMAFDMEFFEGENDPQIYMYLSQLRASTKRMTASQSRMEHSEIMKSLSTDIMYKDFKIYLLKASSLFKSSEHIDSIIRDVLKETFLIMMHFSQNIQCFAYLLHLKSKNKREAGQPALSEIKRAFSYLSKMNSLYMSKKNLQTVVSLMKVVKLIRRFMDHLTVKYKNTQIS